MGALNHHPAGANAVGNMLALPIDARSDLPPEMQRRLLAFYDPCAADSPDATGSLAPGSLLGQGLPAAQGAALPWTAAVADAIGLKPRPDFTACMNAAAQADTEPLPKAISAATSHDSSSSRDVHGAALTQLQVLMAGMHLGAGGTAAAPSASASGRSTGAPEAPSGGTTASHDEPPDKERGGAARDSEGQYIWRPPSELNLPGLFNHQSK